MVTFRAKYAGTCRDCGLGFPAGTVVEWERRQGASCCNGTQAPSPGHEWTPGVEERLAGLPDPRPQEPQADRAFIVDGAMKMEWVEEKTFQEGVAFQGDSVIYEERVYSGYNWMCVECRLVWGKQHQAINCGKRNHVPSYEDTYGVREVVNGVPSGPNMYTIIREAVRREKSKDTPPVAPAPVPVEYLPYGGVTDGKDSEWVPVNYPQADPQDMTSEQMWESMSSVNQPTITTSWN